ncbi:hypothetical protein [Streptomyces sp. NPDC059460]|uniref:hypothetical protein n=1 Tax=Streptomyces sp. NPDC059460 TaxID=3346840 RepID=UPI00367D3810
MTATAPARLPAPGPCPVPGLIEEESHARDRSPDRVLVGRRHDRAPMTRLLVVEDDPQLVQALVITVRARAHDVDTAPDAPSVPLDARADVSLTQPFSIEERRPGRQESRPQGRDVRLTPTEWHPREFLIDKPGRPITQRQLLLDMSRLQTGTVTLLIREIDLDEVVRTATVRAGASPDISVTATT